MKRPHIGITIFYVFIRYTLVILFQTGQENWIKTISLPCENKRETHLDGQTGDRDRSVQAQLAPEKNCQMFDLLPNNHANQSEAETRHRTSCTGTVGSEENLQAETKPEGGAG